MSSYDLLHSVFLIISTSTRIWGRQLKASFIFVSQITRYPKQSIEHIEKKNTHRIQYSCSYKNATWSKKSFFRKASQLLLIYSIKITINILSMLKSYHATFPFFKIKLWTYLGMFQMSNGFLLWRRIHKQLNAAESSSNMVIFYYLNIVNH